MFLSDVPPFGPQGLMQPWCHWLRGALLQTVGRLSPSGVSSGSTLLSVGQRRMAPPLSVEREGPGSGGRYKWELRNYGNPKRDISHAYNFRSACAPANPSHLTLPQFRMVESEDIEDLSPVKITARSRTAETDRPRQDRPVSRGSADRSFGPTRNTHTPL